MYNISTHVSKMHAFGRKSCHYRSYHKYKSKANLISNKYSTFGAPNQYVTMVLTMEISCILWMRMRVCAKWKVCLLVCDFWSNSYHTNDSHKKKQQKIWFVQQYIVCLFVSGFFFSLTLAMRMCLKMKQNPEKTTSGWI